MCSKTLPVDVGLSAAKAFSLVDEDRGAEPHMCWNANGLPGPGTPGGETYRSLLRFPGDANITQRETAEGIASRLGHQPLLPRRGANEGLVDPHPCIHDATALAWRQGKDRVQIKLDNFRHLFDQPREP